MDASLVEKPMVGIISVNDAVFCRLSYPTAVLELTIERMS